MKVIRHDSDIHAELEQMYKRAVDTVRVSIQSTIPATQNLSDNADQDREIVAEHAELQRSVNAMQLGDVNKAIVKVVHFMAKDHYCANEALYKQHMAKLRALVPLLSQLSLLAQRSIAQVLAHHRACLKLAHVLLCVFNTLLVKGFCRQPDEADGEEEGEDSNVSDGVGLGDGELANGAKDVSNEIEKRRAN